MKKIFSVLMTILFLSLPFSIHYGTDYLGSELFAALIFGAFISRIVLMPSNMKLLKVIMVCLVCWYCGFIALYESTDLLLFYPVIMSSFFALLFFISLFTDKTLIEQFAQFSGKAYPAEAVAYMRCLTKAWVVLLALNAGVAAYFACCQSAELWLLYNGVIAYIVILTFVALELIYRNSYRRKYFPDL